MTDAVDLACFSYLAGARLLTVDRYPAADTGTEVHGVLHSLAGDGPITALTAVGQHGAVGRTSTARHRAPTGQGPIVHTHGADAAFSAGFAATYLADRDIPICLRLACTTGTAHCTTAHPRSPQGVRT
ncbi:hypothetical protein ACIQGZ_05615 [Streptomyces sp. NPDC092296]|uniref:hypothetical protein n=1 Tax=Streptomyces sp. NPDC092296 TaxID=3366012 RepID=UPI003820275F